MGGVPKSQPNLFLIFLWAVRESRVYLMGTPDRSCIPAEERELWQCSNGFLVVSVGFCLPRSRVTRGLCTLLGPLLGATPGCALANQTCIRKNLLR
ncbi:hypothetical protein EDB85DRAFT_1933175 [Lactarius pseudohatsudake]|nr:hypothetical protein EDB85DRAFT_1933175 [Lactarius pseudohatsudake]